MAPLDAEFFIFVGEQMSEIIVKLPDGSEKKLAQGSSAMDLAMAISSSLAKKVVVAKVNGQVQDLQDPLQNNDQVVLLGHDSPEAQDVICHSCEHVLAAAVVDLFPEAQVSMGPKSHADGFYYDFDIGRPFSEEDLQSIEKKMKALIKDGISFKKSWQSKEEAKKLFATLGQKYKPEILEWIDAEQVSLYQSGHFIDLCRGPHLPSSKFIKAFKILNASGSYWRGDANNEMLQRISGVAFGSQEELDQYLFRIEEAKRRDHRKLGPKHNLFFVSEKFSSWSDAHLEASEARVLLYAPKTLRESSALGETITLIENFLEEFKGSLPSGALNLRGINVVPSDDEQARVDLRIFASHKDANGRKLLADLSNKFNQAHPEILLKNHFEAHAVEDIGPGLVMWLPDGGRLRTLVEEFSKKRHFEHGYDLVYSPHIAKSDLWRISGHLGFYQDSMFAPMNIDGNEYLLKPMNCPFHVLMYKFKPRSYRDLPLRLAEFGTVYRYEMAGVLHGLMRVRGFTQDDAHLFCRWDQLDLELDKVLEFILSMLKAFGFNDFEVNISTRPEKYVGKLEDWERAEKSLVGSVERTGLAYRVDEGGGAFYGPKIDIKLKDCLDRSWQCSTLQLDFNNPERFDLNYINNSGEKERPVMLHRALFGSLERFIGILIEHYAGAFPAWLAPNQIAVLTVSDRHNHHAKKLAQTFKEAGLRAEFKESHEKLGAKIRNAQMDKVPFMVIVGDNEVDQNGGTLRLRNQEDKGFFVMDELVELLKKECSPPV